MGARISSPILVGRDEHVTALARAFDGSATGAPRFVVIRGEAGIGKSRLVREATGAARDGGMLVLVGECLDIGVAGLPYLPIAEALRGLVRLVPPETLDGLLGAGRRDLAVLVPELATDAVSPVMDAAAGLAPSELAQARLFERVLGMLGATAATAPTLLVIEDVQWIDRATRDLLTFLSRNLTDERLAIVLTCRSEELPRGHPILAWLAEIERTRLTTTLELERLDRAAVDRQLRVIAGSTPPVAVTDRIWRLSEGNPLFVEELYAAPADNGEGPSSLVEILLSRVVRLDTRARAVVDAAAVAGRPVEDRLLSEVLETPEPEIDEGLRAALVNGVLELEPARTRYRFRHELLREVVERELLPGTRRRLHERFARQLEAHPELADTSPAGAAGELAHHFAEADLPVEAYARSIAAATASEAVHAYVDAQQHLERALCLEPQLPAGTVTPSDRISLRRRAADDADLGGDFARAMELTRSALALVDASKDPVTAGMLHSRIGYLQWSLDDSATALDAHREAVRLVPPDPPSPERARVLGSLGGALMGAGRWAESRAVCEAAIACALAAGAHAEESRARNMLGSDLVALGEIDAGIEELRQACQIAAQSGPAHMLIVGHYNLGLNLSAADRLEEALAQAEAGRAAAREAGLERRFGQNLAALTADILIRLGRVDRGAEVIAGGLALDPAGVGTTYLSAVRARLAVIRGEHDEAERRLAAIDLEQLDPDVAAYVGAVSAEAMAWSGHPDAALAAAEAGLRHLEGLEDVLWAGPLVALGLRAAADLAESARAQRSDGALAAARGQIAPLRTQLEWLAPRVTMPSGRGWIASARGELARAEGMDDAAAWRAAIESFDAVPEPLAAAYARFRAAEADLRTHGVRADVGDLVRAAALTAEAAGARPLGAAVATLAARARIQTGPAAAGPANSGPSPVASDAQDRYAAARSLGLSAREIEVLELVSAGLSNGEIAQRLFITRKTASAHVTHILDKLGVTNRIGAAMVGARVGLGASPSPPDATTVP